MGGGHEKYLQIHKQREQTKKKKLPYKTNSRKDPETQSLKKVIIIEIGEINTGRLNTKTK